MALSRSDRCANVLNMAQRVFLHVGAMKSGTTYLQSLCQKNSDVLLREHALWYPGTRRNFLATHDAVRFGRREETSIDTWRDLLAEVKAFDGDALISNETLLGGSRSTAAKVVRAFAPAEVHVVVTARDLARVMRSHWQTLVRSGGTRTWGEFSSDLFDAESSARSASNFWRRHDLPKALSPWIDAAPPGGVTLVTVPPEGSSFDVLSRRFFAALDREVGVLEPSRQSNTSLGVYSTELVRRLNEVVHGWEWPRYRRAVKKALSSNVLETHAGVEPKLRLTPEQFEHASARAEEMVSQLQSIDCAVIGTVDDLVPLRSEVGATEDAGDDELLDVALFALAGLSAELADLTLKYERLERELSTTTVPEQRVRSRVAFLVEMKTRPVAGRVKRLLTSRGSEK